MTFVLTPGQKHETMVFPQRMEDGTVKRPGHGPHAADPARLGRTKATIAGRSSAGHTVTEAELPFLESATRIAPVPYLGASAPFR